MGRNTFFYSIFRSIFISIFRSRILRQALVGVVLIIAFESPAGAWGKQGHAGICHVAASLLAAEPGTAFLKDRAFDLGYYCNVPDLVWKRPAHYQVEWYNHFMDMEIFEREIKDFKTANPFSQSRAEFDAAFPQVPDSAGRSFWRIAELMKRADKITADLKKNELTREQRHSLQADWLVTVGALGHYVGDLAQPLHVTENYDGQLSEQKGLHVWFEDEVVNELFLTSDRRLENDVMVNAKGKWKQLASEWKKKPLLELLTLIASDSNKQLPLLLKIDKKTGRNDAKKAAKEFRTIIIDRMALGSVALAALWSRQLGWEFDNVKFYTFVSEPDFIAPEKAEPTASPTPKK